MAREDVSLIIFLVLFVLHYSQLAHSFDLASIMGQTISSTQFFLYGKRHFTKTGYIQHVKKYYTDPVQSSPFIKVGDEGADGVDLTNKVVVVTGANSGIGKQVATYAAAKHARVYLLCRNAERAKAAQQEIIQQTSSNEDNVNVILVDVAELAQVRKAAQEIQAKESAIHALVCNAGSLWNEKTVTSEGNEITFAAHLLGGSYLLSQLLLPQLKAAGPSSRVVFVTSGGMYNFALPEWKYLTTSADDVSYNGVNVYAYAKRGQVLLAERLAKDISDVTFVTTHPGWTDTETADALGDAKNYLHPLRDPWEGAEGICWLVSVDKSQLENGALYLDRKVQPKHLAGPFFTEGSYTKNKPEDVDELMQNLQKAAGL